MTPRILTFVLTLCTVMPSALLAQSDNVMTGLQIMQEVQRRHYFDRSIYEELSIILTDRLGNRDTRNLRRYSRTDAQGNLKYLLVLDTPVDVYGSALLAERGQSGSPELEIYLPAYGSPIRYLQRKGERADIFGMDLSFEDLTWEILDDYQYVYREQKRTGNLGYDVIDVYAAGDDAGSVHPVRRHHVRRDGFYLMQTDFFDNRGRVLKRQTRHDISRSDRNLWNTGMILVENIQKHHTTLIKVNKRIISDDYVPDEAFSLNWLFQNQPPLELEETDDAVIGVHSPVTERLSFQTGSSAGSLQEAY